MLIEDRRFDFNEIEKAKNNILDEYDKNHGLYQNFLDEMEKLINNLLKSQNIKLHLLKSRVKNKNALEEKILKKAIVAKEKKFKLYEKIEDITDVCALRIILLDENEIEKVLFLIEEELLVDEENTNDARKKNISEFGYLSHHSVVSLNDNRSKLSENKKFKTLKFEVQTRTILQHTWAEIEHGLNYKSEKTLDDNLNRHLNRLAATLELIEQGFNQIINEHKKIDFKETPITVISLYKFINKNEMIKELDDLIIKINNKKCIQNNGYDLFELIIKNLKFININSIEKIEENIKNSFTDLKLFLEQFSGGEIPYFNDKGESLIYLSLYEAGNQLGEVKFLNFLKENFKNHLNIINSYKRVQLIKKLN